MPSGPMAAASMFGASLRRNATSGEAQGGGHALTRGGTGLHPAVSAGASVLRSEGASTLTVKWSVKHFPLLHDSFYPSRYLKPTLLHDFQ